MKIAIINKSDSTGGAAVVSFRLMEALRHAGEDARMIVTEKLSSSPYVSVGATPVKIRWAFLAERLRIFIANGFNRSTLFKIDTASEGLDLLNDPFVREADVVMLNWVNQGMLSLKGVEKLSRSGKTVIWTMHDMWCFTGICHHSGECRQYEGECNTCPLLKDALYPRLAVSVQKRKKKVYDLSNIAFVAVSNWLADRGMGSSLFGGKRPIVIPNAFPFEKERDKEEKYKNKGDENREFRLLFGAARLDDTVKGLPILVKATKILSERYPEEASKMHLITFGTVKDPTSLEGIALPHTHLGRVSGAEAVRKVYEDGNAVVSTSLYETLPGTLVEGQAYGCVPVAFARGGQPDIIDHLSTGYLAEWSDDLGQAALNIAEGIIWAYRESDKEQEEIENMKKRMYESAYTRFNEEHVARQYLDLIRSLQNK